MGDLRLKVAGLLFALMAVLHLARFLMKLEVIIGGTTIPVNASITGFVVAGALAFWMLKPTCCSKNHDKH